MSKTRQLLLFISLFVCFSVQSASLRVGDLQCEYLKSPKGLDEKLPRFSWVLTSTKTSAKGNYQTAYRILVADNIKDIKQKQGNIWASEWVHSDQTQQIVFKGKDLLSDRTYYWCVQVKDEAGKESAWSEINDWSTGLFEKKDWTAEWIGSDVVFDPSLSESNIYDPWFRKTFDLNKKPSRAMLFVASVGYHELYVNGERVGDEVLAPAVTDHTKRARYIAYDIAKKLKPGKNVIALWLGTSWSVFPPYNMPDRPRTPMVIAQADIYESNNSTPVLRIKTDNSWKTHPSPNKLSCKWSENFFGGEIWDDNKSIPDWNKVGYNDEFWEKATLYNLNLKLSAQRVEGNKLYDEIKPISIETRPDGSYRVDMGVNFAGWTNIQVKGQPHDTIHFLFSEREQAEMTFRNFSAYVVGTSGEGTFRNRFNYSSGRWITIKGLKEKPELSDIKGWMVRTAYQPAVTFECSDSLQNWIYDRVLWTYQNLSIGGYIVDCPQRERLGYGGDAHATSETGLLNFKTAAFYTKWMQDWQDVRGTEPVVGDMNRADWARQGIMSGRFLKNGILPHTAPTYAGGGGPSWGSITVALPWLVYQQTGDTRILEKNYELMDEWLQFLQTKTVDGIMRRFGGNWDFLADWLWPNATAEGMNNNKPEAECFNSCFLVYNFRLMEKIANALGRADDAKVWQEKAIQNSQAIHHAYFDPTDDSYCDKSMGNLAIALLADVPPSDLRVRVIKRLEKEILDIRKGHIHVGITGGAVLFRLLRQENRPDLVYSMLSQTDYPGWGYMKANGATTIWEMWEKDLPGHSLLHSSYLYPGAWYIDALAGIRADENHPGYKHFFICPPLLGETTVKWVKCSFDSPAGRIKSEWNIQNGKATLKIVVPPNTTATVRFPSKEMDGNYTLHTFNSGHYTLTNQ
ncbi:family 78 glycoside hydrolase catalytic domain [Massilibacteroides sp.]|uniref:family 78 glycoside hydrolase catalytic domain n=1 Tax=Massilibacteroides sp. TaxID=2034766 RepID=UPI0026055E80|nr:family 78 glycoside hydrolase catalytic domain [Massilibacteroides sp.]MDD4515222.1 family 78 glycoside hydrolase catalytic domain [Massilibacteroides sp.]